MTNTNIVVQQQQNIKPKSQKREKSLYQAEALEGEMSQSESKYLQELRQLWQDAS